MQDFVVWNTIYGASFRFVNKTLELNVCIDCRTTKNPISNWFFVWRGEAAWHNRHIDRLLFRKWKMLVCLPLVIHIFGCINSKSHNVIMGHRFCAQSEWCRTILRDEIGIYHFSKFINWIFRIVENLLKLNCRIISPTDTHCAHDPDDDDKEQIYWNVDIVPSKSIVRNRIAGLFRPNEIALPHISIYLLPNPMLRTTTTNDIVDCCDFKTINIKYFVIQIDGDDDTKRQGIKII